jgi:hypothetical protein
MGAVPSSYWRRVLAGIPAVQGRRKEESGRWTSVRLDGLLGLLCFSLFFLSDFFFLLFATDFQENERGLRRKGFGIF